MLLLLWLGQLALVLGLALGLVRGEDGRRRWRGATQIEAPFPVPAGLERGWRG